MKLRGSLMLLSMTHIKSEIQLCYDTSSYLILFQSLYETRNQQPQKQEEQVKYIKIGHTLTEVRDRWK